MAIPGLDELPRAELVPVALDYMLAGMIVTRAMLPQIVVRGGDFDLMNQLAIEEWMGASPVYTGRMRRLMRVEGDDVEAIMKVLQLDVGFVHQYMDVGYQVIDAQHAEFWLAHCGALIDTEPHGEEQVFGMCHTIEDPTFDATALATNPRARIRPIHRPPRRPADRDPHCHWTITIDPTNEPVGPIELTDRVAKLPVASLPNHRPSGRTSPGRPDYAGRFEPTFQLSHLADDALIAAAREFQIQAHLLMCASDLALRDRFGADTARGIMADAWVGASWIASERLARGQTAADPIDRLAAVLSLQPMIPPGFTRQVEIAGEAVHVELRPVVSGLLDVDHPGWLGLLAGGERGGLEAMAHGVDPHAQLGAVTVGTDRVTFDVTTSAGGAPTAEPDPVAMLRVGMVSGWSFDTTDRVADPVRR
jgi:hypothetical protein